MLLGDEEDLVALKRVGRVVKETLAALEQHAVVGVSTLELDAVAKEVFGRHGARSAPTLVYGFPGTVLISVNDEIVHGIPGARKLEQGDIVKLDVTPELGGYIADAASTVVVAPEAKDEQRVKLAQTARDALEAAIRVARAGTPLRNIGAVVEQTVRHAGFTVIPDLCGHGVGRTIHEAPEIIPNYPEKRVRGVLKEGMVITIEPIIAVGSGSRFTRCYTADDKWTIKTQDGTDAAHFEHSLVITKGAPLILTA